MKKTLPCLIGMLALVLSPWAAFAIGSSSPVEVEAVSDMGLQTIEGGLTEKQFGCGLAVAGLIIGTATLGPGYLAAFGLSLTFHGALFACF